MKLDEAMLRDAIKAAEQPRAPGPIIVSQWQYDAIQDVLNNRDKPKAYEALPDSGKRARRPYGSDSVQIRANLRKARNCRCGCHVQDSKNARCMAPAQHVNSLLKCCPVPRLPWQVMNEIVRYVPSAGYPPDIDDLLWEP